MAILQMTIKGQELKIRNPLIVAKTINYIDAKLTFQTTSWDGLKKFVRFEHGEHKYIAEVRDDMIPKDEGLNLTDGVWTVFVQGFEASEDGLVERITTESAKITVQNCGEVGDEFFPDMTVAERLVAQSVDARNDAEGFRNEAKTFRDEAEGFANDANESAERTALSETNAKTSEENAKRSEENASQSFANAKTSETNAGTQANAAKTSADNAKVSEENALISENNAKESEDNAKTSENNAKNSEDNAKRYYENTVGIISEVEAVKDSAVSAINTGKTNALESIAGSKDSAIGEINTKKNESIEAIQQKRDDFFAEIPESFDEIKEEVTHVKGEMNELDSRLSESITELYDSTKSGIPYWKSLTNLFAVGGFIAKSGRMTVANTYITPFFKVKKGQHIYTFSSQDFNNTFGIGLYATDEETSFIKGVNVCEATTSYRLVQHDYEVEIDCYARVCTMDAEGSLRSTIMVSDDKINSDVFVDVYGTIGDVETEYIDVTDDIFANASEGYLNESGEFLAYSNAICSDFIEVKIGETYYYNLYTLYNNLNVHFYTERKNHIRSECKGTSTYIDGVVVVEPIIKYMRVCSFNKTVRPNYFIKKLGKVDVVEMLNRKVADKYFKSPVSYADVTGEKSIGYLIDNGGVEPSATTYATSEYIDITKYDWFKCRVSYGWAARGYVITDENKEKLFSLSSTSGKHEIIRLNTADILAEYPTAKYIRFCGDSSGKEELTVYANELTTDADKIFKDVAQCGNVLYGRKIAFCGDSFTEASNLGNEYYDKFQSCYKSYGWMIATRNAMNLYHDGISGTTMHIVDVDNPNDRKPFSYQRYKDVPKDCDYILLQFGLNESGLANSAETKGTKDSTDCTTMWGSWNTVLEYLITECPTARIGVIMSDAWMPQNYYLTLKEICEWWGIPMLDLGGDPNVPLMNSGRRNGCGLTVNPKVVKLRNDTFYTDPVGGDSHPNYKGHVWRSTVIENFIRSL